MPKQYQLKLGAGYEPLGWVDVTPAGMNMDPDGFGLENFGVQDVLVDPVRPSDFYAFVCLQGVWRSTDYGLTWTKVSTGANGAHIDTGKPWSACISLSTSRDPATSPTLWTMAGVGDQWGVYRSTNWGVDWTHATVAGSSQDVYSIDVDPYDDTHLILSTHDTEDVLESTDSGDTWTVVASPANGESGYVFFLDTGTAGTTRGRWLHIPQDGNGSGAKFTTDNGASWAAVTSDGDFAHYHGCSQLCSPSAGVIYLGATGGVHVSTDAGASWTVEDGAQEQNGCFMSSKTLIASFGWATHGPWDPRARIRARSGGAWSDLATPDGMLDGAKRIATTMHGSYPVWIFGAWNGGLWRYVEAP